MLPELLLLVASFILFLTFRLARVGSRESSLPPGPPTIPLLGYNLPFSN